MKTKAITRAVMAAFVSTVAVSAAAQSAPSLRTGKPSPTAPGVSNGGGGFVPGPKPVPFPVPAPKPLPVPAKPAPVLPVPKPVPFQPGPKPAPKPTAPDDAKQKQVLIDITGRTTTRYNTLRLPKVVSRVRAVTEVKLSAKVPNGLIVDGDKRISGCRPAGTKMGCAPVVSKKYMAGVDVKFALVDGVPHVVTRVAPGSKLTRYQVMQRTI